MPLIARPGLCCEGCGMADDIDEIVAAFLSEIDDDRLDREERLDGVSRKVWDIFDEDSSRAWWAAFRELYEQRIGSLKLSSKQAAIPGRT